MKREGATKEAMGHSPLPWKLTDEAVGCAVCAKNGVDSYGVRDAKNELVCVSEHDSFAPSRSDCEFIITAVNERERLREVLTGAVIPYEAILMDSESRKWIAPVVWEAIKNAVTSARAVLNDEERSGG